MPVVESFLTTVHVAAPVPALNTDWFGVPPVALVQTTKIRWSPAGGVISAVVSVLPVLE